MQFPLVRTSRWRHLETYATLMFTIVAALFAFILLVSFLGESDLLFKLIPLGGAVVLTPIWAMVRAQLRAVFGPPGSISLGASELILDSPRWFRVPLAVPLIHVQEVTFGKGEQRSWWDGLELNALSEKPNLTITFDPPLRIPRGTARLFPTRKINLRERSFLYVTGRVENPEGARQAFSQQGLA